MTTSLYRYRINGVIDTAQPVLKNIENIANSCSTWVSYDSLNGLWSVIINKAGTSVHSFSDDNIIGGITVNGTGLTELYNSVEVSYPSRDVDDQGDVIRIDIPTVDRFANEPDNTLTINLPLSNEPVQAMIVGLQELKQSRVDLVVEFKTDWSKINVQAGDVIDLTSSVYGFDQKLFRVIRMEEVDDDGAININITALEYDAEVYNSGDLSRYVISNEDGVITAGLLGTPSTPAVTKFELNSRPRIVVETTVPDGTDPLNPAGIVEGIEFWYYKIPDAELPTWEIVDDATRVYSLYKTARPTGGATTFAGGSIVEIDIDNVNDGNFLIKCRAVNSTTSGDFSVSSGLVEYSPTQTAGAIASNTAILDNAGNTIGGLAGANILLKLLGDYLGTSETPMADIVQSGTGGMFADDAFVEANMLPQGFMITASTGSVTNASVPQTGTAQTIYTTTVVPAYSGNYQMMCIMDQNTSGARGGRGTLVSGVTEPDDFVSVSVSLYDPILASNVISEASGSTGAFFWTDYAMAGSANLVAGRTYTLTFRATLNTESNPTQAGSFTVNWNLYTVAS